MAKDQVFHPGRHDSRLTLITRGDAPPPLLDKFHEWVLTVLAVSAYRLHRARQRIKDDESTKTKMRDEIIQRVPKGLYGFRVRNRRRTVTVTLARRTLKQITDNAGFIEHLGPHASEVIKGMQVGHPKLYADLAAYMDLVGFLQDRGARDGGEITLVIDRDKLKGLVEAGEVEPADKFFFESDDGPVSVLVEVEPTQ